jgi:hypothetical protein
MTCHDLSTDFYKILDDEDKYSVYCSNNHIYGIFIGETHYLNKNVFNTQFTIPDDVPHITNNIIQSGSNGTIEQYSNINANFFLKISNLYYNMSRVGSPFVYGINIAKIETIT